MDERETLIRVEQQLADSVKNQSLILDDLKEIFGKIDEESKYIAIVKSDLNTHLETGNVRREESERRFKTFEEQISRLSQQVADAQAANTKSANDAETFKKQVMTSIGLLKWIVGVMAVLISTVWPIVTFLLEKK
jgi:chromosome segregation ATPase